MKGETDEFHRDNQQARSIGRTGKVPPDQYLHLWVVIRHLQKKSFKSSKDALRNIFALEGCLKDETLSSVVLQHKVADLWSEKMIDKSCFIYE
jgi:hypothetical protein